MRTQSTILVPLVAVFVTVGAIAFASSYRVVADDEFDAAAADLSIDAERSLLRLDAALRERSSAVAAVAAGQAGYLAAAEQASIQDTVDLRRLSVLDPMIALSQDLFVMVSLLDAHGTENVRYETGEPMTAQLNRSDTVLFMAAQDAPRGGAMVRLEGVDGERLVFVAPVPDATGGFLGAVWAEAPLTAVTNDLRADVQAYSALGSRLDATPADPVVAKSVRVAAAVGDPTVDSSEANLVGTSSPLPLAGAGGDAVVLAGSVDKLAVAAPLVRSFAMLAVAFTATLAIVTSVLIIVLRHTLRPLEATSRAVAAIGGGDFEARAEPAGGDEVRRLARGVNRMAAELAAREAERTMDEEQRLVNQRLMTLGSMSAGIAHEVNNPLTYMIGNCELVLFEVQDVLDEDDLTDVERERFERIARALRTQIEGGRRIAGIVKSLRLLSRPQSEETVLSVREIVEASVDLLGPRLAERIDVQVNVEGDPQVRGDATELGQVVLNLLMNAADAAPEKQGAVRVKAGADGAFAFIVVEDNGPGIPDDKRERIFDPFFTTKAQGTGLGLSLTRRIVEATNGRIHCLGSDLGGAAFHVELPLTSDVVPVAPTRGLSISGLL